MWETGGKIAIKPFVHYRSEWQLHRLTSEIRIEVSQTTKNRATV